MDRRALLLSAAACVLPFVLSRCGEISASSETLSAQVLADTSAALNQLSIVLPALTATTPPVLTQDQVAPLLRDIAEAQSMLATISATTPKTPGASVLSTVLGYVNAVLGAVPVALIPPPYNLIVTAAVVIGKEIESYVASIQPPVTPTPTPAAARAARYGRGMSTEEARTILHANSQ